MTIENHIQELIKRLQIYFNKSIFIINKDNWIEYTNEIKKEMIEINTNNQEIQYNIFYLLEKDLKLFVKYLKFFYKSNKTLDFSYYIYLYYILECYAINILLKNNTIINNQKRLTYLLYKIENIDYELLDIPFFNADIFSFLKNLYGKIDISSFKNNINRSNYDHIQFMQNPIDKFYRNCSLLYKEDCKEECKLEKNDCIEDINLKSFLTKSIHELDLLELILFISGYEQYSNPSIYFNIDELKYNREELINISTNLIYLGLNQVYPISLKYKILKECNLTKNEFIRLCNFIIDYQKNNDNMFELYIYMMTILGKCDFIPNQYKSDLFYIMLFSVAYNYDTHYILEEFENTNNFNNKYVNDYYNTSFNFIYNGDYNEYFYKFQNLKLDLISSDSHMIQDYCYFTINELKKNYDYEWYNTFILPLHIDNVKLDLDYDTKEFEYIYLNINPSVLKCYVYDPSKELNNSLMYTMNRNDNELSTFILNSWFNNSKIEYYEKIPIVTKINDIYILIDNFETYFKYFMLNNQYITVKFIPEYYKKCVSNIDLSKDKSYGLKKDDIKIHRLNPLLNSVKFMLNKFNYSNYTLSLLFNKKNTKNTYIVSNDVTDVSYFKNFFKDQDLKHFTYTEFNPIEEIYKGRVIFVNMSKEFQDNKYFSNTINRYDYIKLHNEDTPLPKNSSIFYRVLDSLNIFENNKLRYDKDSIYVNFSNKLLLIESLSSMYNDIDFDQSNTYWEDFKKHVLNPYLIPEKINQMISVNQNKKLESIIQSYYDDKKSGKRVLNLEKMEFGIEKCTFFNEESDIYKYISKIKELNPYNIYEIDNYYLIITEYNSELCILKLYKNNEKIKYFNYNYYPLTFDVLQNKITNNFVSCTNMTYIYLENVDKGLYIPINMDLFFSEDLNTISGCYFMLDNIDNVNCLRSTDDISWFIGLQETIAKKLKSVGSIMYVDSFRYIFDSNYANMIKNYINKYDFKFNFNPYRMLSFIVNINISSILLKVYERYNIPNSIIKNNEITSADFIKYTSLPTFYNMVVEFFTDLRKENKFKIEMEEYYFEKMLTGNSKKELIITSDLNTFIQKVNEFLLKENSDQIKIELLYYLFDLLKNNINYIFKNY